MKWVVYTLFITLFSGCENTYTDKYPHDSQLAKQWAIHINEDFYRLYEINHSAGINAEYMLSNYTGKGVKIAVIDFALDTTHSELEGQILSTKNIRNGDDNVSSDNYTIDYHGTAVTGIIAAKRDSVGITGIAPDAQVIFIHLDLDGYVSDSEFIDAFLEAERQGANIINCSWGTGAVSESVKEEIIRLSDKGIAIVFASGNSDNNMTGDESDIDEVIAIGASNENNLRASYSNHGEHLDFLVPGGSSLGIMTLAGYENYLEPYAYDKFYGTSASAPILSATLALFMEAYPTKGVASIIEAMKDNASKIGEEVYVDGHNDYSGWGKIDADKTYFSFID